MKHLGDITKISGYDVPPVDVVIGGSPCQDLSVAGKRAGLSGARSGLFMEQIRIIKEMREADVRRGRTGQFIRPRFMVWENVPGAFSSNKGDDFRAVLEETIRVEEPEAPDVPLPPKNKWPMADCWYGDGWSVAYRVLDSQFWGVPQRRRRIALVADFGGHAAPEILFVRQSVCGDIAEGGSTREETSARTGSGVADTVWCLQGNAVDRDAKMNGIGISEGPMFTLNTVDKHAVAIPINTMLATRHKQLGRGTGFGIGKPDDPQFTISSAHSHAVYVHQNQLGEVRTGTVAGTLNTNSNASGRNAPLLFDARGNGDGKTVCTLTGDHQNRVTDYTAIVVEPLPFDTTQITSKQNGCHPHYGDPCHPLAAGAHPPAIVMATGQGRAEIMRDACTALNCNHEQPKEKEIENATSRNPILRILQETYGTETVFQWRTAIMASLQQTEILQQGVHEDGVRAETKNRGIMDDNTLPCPEIVAEWLLRDMWKHGERGRSSQGWEPSKQQFGELAEIMQKLPQQTAQATKEMFNMWKSGKGIWILRETLSEIQKIRESVYGENKSKQQRTGLIRRLTPLEAERLQGFPDNWTDIGAWTDSKGKLHKESNDSARYKALGNSIALPPWKFVLKRLCAQYERDATMASLFDGIGGFPLIWERLNGPGTCLWASEIEEFPIAVTKFRFPT